VGYHSGPNRVVLLSDFDLIAEAFTKEELSDRPCFKALKIAREQATERYCRFLHNAHAQ